MAAIASPATGATCDLREAGREGRFVHMTDAEFAARYGFTLAEAVAADTLQGMYVATGTGAWVREGDRITPFMFGGQTNYKTGSRSTMVPPYGESATPGSTDGVLIDARPACQAVLDMVALHKNRELNADFSGGLWGIAKRGDGGAHDLDGLVIDQPQEYARRFIGGEFRRIGAGRHLIYVDEGSYSKFEGNWHVRSGADGGSSYGYPIRKWETGIWLRNSAQCRWDLVKVSGFKRSGRRVRPPVQHGRLQQQYRGALRTRLRQQQWLGMRPARIQSGDRFFGIVADWRSKRLQSAHEPDARRRSRGFARRRHHPRCGRPLPCDPGEGRKRHLGLPVDHLHRRDGDNHVVSRRCDAKSAARTLRARAPII